MMIYDIMAPTSSSSVMRCEAPSSSRNPLIISAHAQYRNVHKCSNHFVKSALIATASDEKLGCSFLGMTKTFCFPCKLNITGWLGKSENKAGILYTLRKRLYFAVSKNFLLCYVGQNYFSALRMAQHGLYTSNLFPTLYSTNKSLALIPGSCVSRERGSLVHTVCILTVLGF